MENSVYYKFAVNVRYYSYEIFKYFSVFMYVAIPVDVYDFWQQPLNFDDLYAYLFPRQGLIYKLLYCLYAVFVYCMNIVTTILANICNLQCIANIDLYR
jgi:hypothetical protein